MGSEQRNRFAVEAAQRVSERLARRRVEPLRIVERDEQRLLLGEQAQQVERREPDRPRVRHRPVARCEPQRDLEGVSPRRRERLHSIELMREQVTERREGELPPGLGRSCLQDASPALARRGNTSLPKRRLADSGLAHEHEPRRTRALEEGFDLSELRPPADQPF